MGVNESTSAQLRDGCVRYGWTKPADMQGNELARNIAPQRLEAWFKRFYAVPDIALSVERPRLVNHFSVGADPEFMFLGPKGNLVSAINYGLNAGMCAGADGNTRLVELRAAPSRRVLDVVASLLAALRWLAITHQRTLNNDWVAFPWENDDGMGGHVHIARKQKSRYGDEIRCLNLAMDVLRQCGVFNALGCSRREQYTQYGRKGDVRPQPFGYEYRTFPTWLESPWLAFLTLTIAKLVVHDMSTPTVQVPPAVWIKNLLAAYKGLDDDALLAYRALLAFGLPKMSYSDMKTTWGITAAKLPQGANSVEPKIIEPSKDEIAEMAQHIQTGAPLAMKIPAHFSAAPQLPAGYMPAQNVSEDVTAWYGLAELLSELAVSTEEPFTILGSPEQTVVHISPQFDKALVEAELRARFAGLVTNLTVRVGVEGNYIQIPHRMREGVHIPLSRGFLTCGLFPVWHSTLVQPESYRVWKAAHVSAKPSNPSSYEITI